MAEDNLGAMIPQQDSAESLPARQQDLKDEMPEGIKNMLKIFPVAAQSKLLIAAEEIYQSLKKADKESFPKQEVIAINGEYDGSLEAQIRELDTFLYYNKSSMGSIEHRLFSDVLVSLKELGLQRMIAQKRLSQSEEGK